MEAFTLKSNYDGTCKLDKSHTWKKDQQVFYDKETKAICIFEDCWNKQKAGTPSTGNNGQARQERTPEQKVMECKSMLETIWPMAFAKASEYVPIPVQTASALQNEPSLQDNRAKERMILAEVLWKGMIEEYTR